MHKYTITHLGNEIQKMTTQYFKRHEWSIKAIHFLRVFVLLYQCITSKLKIQTIVSSPHRCIRSLNFSSTHRSLIQLQWLIWDSQANILTKQFYHFFLSFIPHLTFSGFRMSQQDGHVHVVSIQFINKFD